MKNSFISRVGLLVGVLSLSACGSDFEPGDYAKSEMVYHFSADGTGNITGVSMNGKPLPFEYSVTGDTIEVTQYGTSVILTIEDGDTLKRADGRVFTRVAPGE